MFWSVRGRARPLKDAAAGAIGLEVATAATLVEMAEVTFGLPAFFSGFTKRALPLLGSGMIRRPELVERGRRIGTDLAFLATRRAAFGSPA